jgi:hypothetical protein
MERPGNSNVESLYALPDPPGGIPVMRGSVLLNHRIL